MLLMPRHLMVMKNYTFSTFKHKLDKGVKPGCIFLGYLSATYASDGDRCRLHPGLFVVDIRVLVSEGWG